MVNLVRALRHATLAASVTLLGAAIARPATAQAPLTADSLAQIRATVVRASDSIHAIVLHDVNDLQPRARTLVNDYRDHNAEPCEYVQYHRETCEDYDAQRHLLDARRERLQHELKVADSTVQTLEVDVAVLMEHLKSAPVLPAAAKMRDAMVTCAAHEIVSEAADCLTRLTTGRRGAPSSGGPPRP